MPSVANLAISVTARTGGFAKEMRRAQRSLKRFSSSVLASMKRVAMFGGGLAALATGGGLAILTKRSLSAVDAISKLSDRIGLSTEAISGLHHVARITGVGVEGMNKAMEQFVRRLGEAKTGTGETKDALERLGLSADALTSMKTIDAFKAIIAEISKLPDAASRADAAYRMFGRQGVQLLNVVNLGASAFEGLMEEAKKLGLTFTRVAGAQVEAANDAITRLKEVAIGAGQALAIQLSPYITGAADALVEMAVAGEGLGEKVMRGTKQAAQGVAYLADTFAGLRAAIAATKGTLAGILYAISAPLAEFGQLQIDFIRFLGQEPSLFVQRRVAELQGFAGTLVTQMNEAASEMAEAWRAFTEGTHAQAVENMFAEWRESARVAAEEAAQAVEKAGMSMTGVAEATIAAIEKKKSALDKLKAAAKRVWEETRTPMERYKKDVDELRRMLQANLIDWVTYKRAAKAAIEALPLNRLEKLRTAAHDVWKETRTPMERHKARLADLLKMLNANVLSWDTYKRAVNAAYEELKRLTDVKERRTQFAQISLARTAIPGLTTTRQGIQRVTDPNTAVIVQELKQQTRLLAIGAGGPAIAG